MRLSEDDEPKALAKKVGYIWSKQYEEVCDLLPSNIGRVLLSMNTSNSSLLAFIP